MRQRLVQTGAALLFSLAKSRLLAQSPDLTILGITALSSSGPSPVLTFHFAGFFELFEFFELTYTEALSAVLLLVATQL